MPSLRKGVYDKMRILKYRQYHNGRFHYWGYIGKDDTFTAPIHGDSQQFTGLFDKQGKEIYEGDIAAIKFNPRYVERISWRGKPDAIAEIFWDFNGFRLKAKGKEDSRYADFWDDDSQQMCEMSRKHTEVIGNIYENPEKLK